MNGYQQESLIDVVSLSLKDLLLTHCLHAAPLQVSHVWTEGYGSTAQSVRVSSPCLAVFLICTYYPYSVQ